MNDQQSTGNGAFSLQPSAFGLYIGLISGTSMDGIDAALIEIGDEKIYTIATRFVSFDDDLVTDLDDVVSSTHGASLDDLGQLDTRIGQSFATAALDLIDQAGIKSDDVRAIGSHGQTIRHRPDLAYPFTVGAVDEDSEPSAFRDDGTDRGFYGCGPRPRKDNGGVGPVVRHDVHDAAANALYDLTEVGLPGTDVRHHHRHLDGVGRCGRAGVKQDLAFDVLRHLVTRGKLGRSP